MSPHSAAETQKMANELLAEGMPSSADETPVDERLDTITWNLAGIMSSKISFPCLRDMGMSNFYATWGHQELPYTDHTR